MIETALCIIPLVEMTLNRHLLISIQSTNRFGIREQAIIVTSSKLVHMTTHNQQKHHLRRFFIMLLGVERMLELGNGGKTKVRLIGNVIFMKISSLASHDFI